MVAVYVLSAAPRVHGASHLTPGCGRKPGRRARPVTVTVGVSSASVTTMSNPSTRCLRATVLSPGSVIAGGVLTAMETVAALLALPSPSVTV